MMPPLLAALLACGAATGAAGPDETTLQLVQVVLKTPTAELDPVLAGAFLKVQPGSLPKRLRRGARVKQLELNALIKVAEGKKKGTLRMTGGEECPTPALSAADIPMLLKSGFVEASEDALFAAQTRTKCSSIDMQCAFTLHVVEMPKGAKPRRRYFFQEQDPMLAVVGTGEARQRAEQTNFFGAHLACMKP